MIGIVLAGGQSKRFGEDKALAQFQGETLIENAVHVLKSLETPVMVITSGQRDYSFLGCRVERDEVPDKGPLGGLLTACHLFPKDSLLVITCDMPLLTSEMLEFLQEKHHRKNKVTLFRSEVKRYQPFPGIYETTLASQLSSALEEGRLSLQDILRKIPEKIELENPFPRSALSNINDKADLNLLKNS